jgi:hypothetical protein
MGGLERTKSPATIQVQDMALGEAMYYGSMSRKNFVPPNKLFVTIHCPLTTVGEFVTSIQLTGGVASTVDCNVNPAAFVGQVSKR